MNFSNRQLLGWRIVLGIVFFTTRSNGRTSGLEPAPDTAMTIRFGGRVLGRVASSSASSQASIDQAAKRIGDLLLDGGRILPNLHMQILIEADPLLAIAGAC